MPDLSKLLREDVLDEFEDVLPPEGYWFATIRGYKIYDTDRDGEPLTDKNGDEYARAVMYFVLTEPDDVVGDATAFMEEAEDMLVTYNHFTRGRRDAKKILRMITACGEDVSGLSVEQALKQAKKNKMTAKVRVEHGEYDGEAVANITEILPI